MRIGELSRRCGLAPSAIRYYEELGLLGDVERVGGQRVFDERHERRLAFIQVAQRAGFSLIETREMIEHKSPSDAWRALAVEKAGELDQSIRDATRMKRLLGAVATCRCASLDACPHLDDSLQQPDNVREPIDPAFRQRRIPSAGAGRSRAVARG